MGAAANDMNVILEKVRQFAEEAHGDQQRKFSGDPYINHLVRVMNMCREYTSDIAMLSAALLHDVLEDTGVSADEMKAFLLSVMDEESAERTVALVKEMSDVYVKEDYPKWNRRKRKQKEAERISKTSADSQTLKYADLIDNCTGMSNNDPEFAALFLRECRDLMKRIDKGDPQLYKRAIEVVTKEIDALNAKRNGPGRS